MELGPSTRFLLHITNHHRSEQMTSTSKTFIGGAVCREFEPKAPAAEEMLDHHAAANSAQFSDVTNIYWCLYWRGGEKAKMWHQSINKINSILIVNNVNVTHTVAPQITKLIVLIISLIRAVPSNWSARLQIGIIPKQVCNKADYSKLERKYFRLSNAFPG